MTELADKSVNERIGKRLKQVRESLGLSLKDISPRAGFANYQTLSSIEKGQRAIKASELSALSALYSRDLSYFLTEDEPVELAPVVAWRGVDPGVNRKPLEAQLHRLLMNYKLLEEITGEDSECTLELWEKGQQQLTYEDVTRRADELRKSMNLGYRPASNLADALEKDTNTKIVNWPLGGVGSALSTRGEFGYAIILDTQEAPWRRNSSLAHELFHLLADNVYPLETLHQEAPAQKPIEETLADVFASALLLPQEPLLTEIRKRSKDNKVEWMDLLQIAFEFGVSREALVWGLRRIGVLSQQRAKELVESVKLRSMDQHVRSGSYQQALAYSSRFVSLGLKALRQGKISKGKFCEIFGISRTQFSDFIADRGDLEDFSYESEIELDHT
ncbi:MAG: ImmA/IrrE family metallo-endopeptidase [candidate division Zixibacteria bacterium]|nr:ImmA/IrrE family metallo-endopeptidase [candidate division Zixibacteria bacterium]